MHGRSATRQPCSVDKSAYSVLVIIDWLILAGRGEDVIEFLNVIAGICCNTSEIVYHPAILPGMDLSEGRAARHWPSFAIFASSCTYSPHGGASRQ